MKVTISCDVTREDLLAVEAALKREKLDDYVYLPFGKLWISSVIGFSVGRALTQGCVSLTVSFVQNAPERNIQFLEQEKRLMTLSAQMTVLAQGASNPQGDAE